MIYYTDLGYEVDTYSLTYAGFAAFVLLVLVNLAHSIKKVSHSRSKYM